MPRPCCCDSTRSLSYSCESAAALGAPAGAPRWLMSARSDGASFDAIVRVRRGMSAEGLSANASFRVAAGAPRGAEREQRPRSNRQQRGQTRTITTGHGAVQHRMSSSRVVDRGLHMVDCQRVGTDRDVIAVHWGDQHGRKSGDVLVSSWAKLATVSAIAANEDAQRFPGQLERFLGVLAVAASLACLDQPRSRRSAHIGIDGRGSSAPPSARVSSSTVSPSCTSRESASIQAP